MSEELKGCPSISGAEMNALKALRDEKAFFGPDGGLWAESGPIEIDAGKAIGVLIDALKWHQRTRQIEGVTIVALDELSAALDEAYMWRDTQVKNFAACLNTGEFLPFLDMMKGSKMQHDAAFERVQSARARLIEARERATAK